MMFKLLLSTVHITIVCDHYSSMSVSILYIRSDDPNNIREVCYNLVCIGVDWEITGRQPTAVKNNDTVYADSCYDLSMDEYSG